MSKNITIQEGGTAKQMTVNKLKTDKVGGGTCLWVPEDDVSLEVKSITENGTYKASDDGKYGYSQVTVNVPGGPGSANPDGTPSMGGGTPSSPGGGTPSYPGGPGSAIAGHDSSDGNDYVIGVDSNGGIVKTLVPSSIDIVEPPTKTTYTDGEPIDTTGMVAVLRDGNGNIYTSEEYPDGQIPLEQLTIPSDSAIAHYTPVEESATSDLVSNPISFGNGDVRIYVNDDQTRGIYIKGGGRGCLIHDAQGNSIDLLTMSSSVFTYEWGEIRNGVDVKMHTGLSRNMYNYNGETVYYESVSTSFTIYKSGNCPLNEAVDLGYGSWTVMHGTVVGIQGNQAVTIEWKNPYNGRTLQKTYNITANAQTNNNNTNTPGGGLSEDSGGSDSGGGTNI